MRVLAPELDRVRGDRAWVLCSLELRKGDASAGALSMPATMPVGDYASKRLERWTQLDETLRRRCQTAGECATCFNCMAASWMLYKFRYCLGLVAQMNFLPATLLATLLSVAIASLSPFFFAL